MGNKAGLYFVCVFIVFRFCLGRNSLKPWNHNFRYVAL